MKTRSSFVCQECGYSQSQWAGRCPNCDTWNSLVESIVESSNSKHPTSVKSKIYRLGEIKIEGKVRLSTGIGELDNVLGGGLVPGEVVLVAGEPGIGKSTLLTQVSLNMNKVLYICGEESASQVGLRVKRLGKTSEMYLLEGTDVDQITAEIENMNPEVVIVDSIQTLTTQDLAGTSGSVGQVRECAWRLTEVVKRLQTPMFLVGHVTKEGAIAGPRVLEHMVDCVLWFEGERGQSLRLLRVVKNRFGSTDDVGVFEIGEKGLAEVVDPSQMMLAERVVGVPGSVVSVVLEGKRPILVEIQGLVVPSQLAVPRRVATGVDMARLQMLVAVLLRRAGMHIENHDIFVNVTGGIKLADRGVDLAICLAIASAFLNRPLENNIAAVGEVGLLGEVRKVTGLEKRIKEAKKLGYKVASAESGKDVAAAVRKLLRD